MTKSALKEKFARLGPTQAVGLVCSGSSEVLSLTLAHDVRKVRAIDAILALRRRGLSMLKAKRAVEAVLAHGECVIVVPIIENISAIAYELRDAGIATSVLTPRSPNVKQLRERLGLTQEQFALRYGLDIDAVRNWEYGRREPDTAAKTYLCIIEREPERVAEMVALPLP